MSRRSLSRAPRHPPLLPLLVSLMLALGIVLGLPVRASADGPTTFSNTTSIAIPGVQTPDPVPPGPASPYPSNITVSGMTGSVTKVTVTFHNLTHGILNDIDAMVVAPSGDNLVVLSDASDSNSFTFANNATLTFDDAGSAIPNSGNVPTGTYRPTNRDDGKADPFPSPAPNPSGDTTLGQAFTGISGSGLNGTWSLFALDDTEGDVGSMAGGWSLTITTAADAATTTTTVTSSDSTSTTGDSVTFTATIRTGATPVITGTVQFAADGADFGGARPLNAAGVATVSTSELTEGSHVIRATYSGATGFLGSSSTVNQRVDNPTVVDETTFCNTGRITPPDRGIATPYPSNISVSGLPGLVTKVTATLKGLTHPAPYDLDVLVSGPTPARNLVLLSDVGLATNPDDSTVSDVNLTFDDAAATGVPSPIVSGTFKPTNLSSDTADSWPDPAPNPSSATALSTFNGASANGTWSLWVVDDAIGDAGSISGGWCLTITSQNPTTTDLTSSLNPSTFGQEVTFTATVTESDDGPVTEGTVQFSDGGADLGAPVPINGSGVATFVTGDLAVGSHSIEAAYLGTGDFGGSDATLTQVVDLGVTETMLTSNNNPSDVGESVTFTATVTDADGDPLTSGSVQFNDDGTPLAPVVALAADGTATFTTATLTAGTHPITATFVETAQFGQSSDDLDQVVNRIATETSLISDNNPSDVGESVTFTATVTDADGDPLTSGSVQFNDDGTPLAPVVALAADGTATFTTATLTAGTHPITATFVETAQFGQSSDDLDQVVNRIATETSLISDNNPSEVGELVTFTATVTAAGGGPVTGTVQFSDDGTNVGSPVTVEADGTAQLPTDALPEGSHPITATFVQTPRFAESSSDPLQQVVGLVPTTTVLGSAPNPSDVGEPVTFTATVSVMAGGGPVAPGTVQFSVDGTDRGAPVAVDANGVATLTVNDLAAGSHPVAARPIPTSRFAGSPSNTVAQVVERIETTTVLQSVPNPSDPTESVTFTAIVTDPSSDPVTTGSVTFTVDGIPITGGSVALNSLGIATFDTAALASGAHTVVAAYAENATYGSSAATLNQVVRPVAAANGPYTVAEGANLTLDAAGSTAGAIYAWDVNGDGDFTDATGEAPTLTWDQLQGLGVNDGPSTRAITLRVTLDGGTADSEADLAVSNTAPASVLTGGLAATVGVPFTIKVGADDPSSADMAALFTYTVDWGDGSPILSVDGPADPPVTHTYTAPGDYAASFTATDKDGGTGAPTSVTVRAGDAPIVTPSPTPTTSAPDDDTDYDDTDYDDTDYDDTDPDSGDTDLASTGSTVGPGTIVLGLALLIGGGGALVVSRRRRLGGPRHRD